MTLVSEAGSLPAAVDITPGTPLVEVMDEDELPEFGASPPHSYESGFALPTGEVLQALRDSFGDVIEPKLLVVIDSVQFLQVLTNVAITSAKTFLAAPTSLFTSMLGPSGSRASKRGGHSSSRRSPRCLPMPREIRRLASGA